jgi:hypothetical protein
MTERAQTELDAMSERIASVLNGVAHKLPIEAADVDLRLVAELCWAIGVTPEITLRHRQEPAHDPA